MKPELVEMVDFDEKQIRRHLNEILRAAETARHCPRCRVV